MLHILHPSHANWFYESLAAKIAEDLRPSGIDSTLVTAEEFAKLDVIPPEQSILIVNLSECARTSGAPGFAYGDLAALRQRLRQYRKRALLTLDCISTNWFAEQLEVADGALTHIFDLCMAPQLDAKRIAGCRYVWIPECFSALERSALFTDTADRPIPWSTIGHQTAGRSTLVDELVRTLSPQGLVFMPGLRPYSFEGSRSFSPEAINRVLRKSRIYVWTSHHPYPYHEGLRALHAVQNGCAPAKICPRFAGRFQQLPWVYPSISALVDAAARLGWQNLARSAEKFILDRGTLGTHLAAALSDS